MAFGIYIHWPYCTRICPYCDFNVYRHRENNLAKWRNTLLEDIRFFSEKTRERELSSIYFGGGTPSLMPPELVEELISACDNHWGLAEGAEITLEANPTDAEQQHFKSFASAGINRLSLGVQSFDDAALTFLGRNHSAKEARSALNLSLATFPRVTLDLIYARPDQTLKAWEAELANALSSGVSHLSLYQLTVEPKTAFQKAVERQDWSLPADPMQADFFQSTQDQCEAAGLPAYEISNHAKPGDESRHNHIYWTYEDYVGIGPGAHGRLTLDGQKHETLTTLQPGEYLSQRPEQRFHFTALSPKDQAAEYLMMALRLRAGMSLSKYGQLSGAPLPEANLAQLTQDGLVEKESGQLRLTKAGRPLLNPIVLELLS